MTITFPRVGDRFLDRYRIVEVLGAGGMSRVYGAVQDGLDRKVAIKLLAPAGAENLTSSQFDNIVARFEREAKLISSFRSPHTVVMYDYGRDGDYLFMILEHVDGDNLHQLVENSGPLPASRVARIMRQALASLAEAHQMGILHRDIKPQNIMVYEHLGDPDNVKVLDFGIAKAIGETGKDQRKLTEERTIVGTPSYMSPEQILGHKLGPGSDIYSLGLVAYEMLFGIVAVEADSAVSTMARHLAPAPIEIPDDRNMPSGFLDILRKMIEKDVELRYRSAADVFADLNAWDGGDPNLTLPRISMSRLPQQQQDTLDGVPPVAIPQPTEQAAPDGNQPLVVGSALLLTLAILLAVAVVVMLVWMMQPPTDAAVAAAMPDKPTEEAPTTVAEPVEDEPTEELAVAEREADENSEPAEPEEEPEPAAEPATEPAAEPDEKPAPKAAVARKSTDKKQAQQAEPAEEQLVDAVEPPEPLVVVPPQPEPAPAAAKTEPVVTPEPEKKAEPKPEPKKTVAKKAEPKKTEKKSDDDDKKKKKKKKTAPPLSF